MLTYVFLEHLQIHFVYTFVFLFLNIFAFTLFIYLLIDNVQNICNLIGRQGYNIGRIVF